MIKPGSPMKLWIGHFTLIMSLAAASLVALHPQQPRQRPNPNEEEQDTKLPNGKSQRDEILKNEHEQNIKDAALLVEMAEELKADLEKNDTFVLSMGTLKKTDDIEKLVKKIRARLRH